MSLATTEGRSSRSYYPQPQLVNGTGQSEKDKTPQPRVSILKRLTAKRGTSGADCLSRQILKATYWAAALGVNLSIHSLLKHVTVSTTFDYYTQVFAPAHALILGKNNAYLTKVVPLATQHPVLFEGLIALAQCHLTARYDLTRPNKESLYHRGQTLQLLRCKATSSSTPPDEAVIWTSILLLGIDSIYKDHVSWRAHMNGIIGMIKLRGGLDQIDPTLRTIILHTRSMWVLMTDKAFVPKDPAFDISLPSEQLPPPGSNQPILQNLCKVYTDAGNIYLDPNEATRFYSSFRESPGSLEESVYLALLI